ncbi:hypothetical protein KVV02_003209 [Mortierella alpina]|uniref:Uncharacterized protein n=1 Tax=Mortierella alpina TaxID=64518 RepID=A0A9P7ZZK0_MORAP|nr:hypothetical protein KVV02_003209 [Mortierella alpina]
MKSRQKRKKRMKMTLVSMKRRESSATIVEGRLSLQLSGKDLQPTKAHQSPRNATSSSPLFEMQPWNMGTEVDASAEALASMDIMYLAYSMARVRPIVPDVFVLQMLNDVRRIKELETDVVLLQFWLAGLTGLAESGSSNQRLIWKSLVLVKIPSIISQLESNQEELCATVESTLRQLSFYRGILNECDENITEDTPGDRSNILKAIAVGCHTKGLIRIDRLEILDGISDAQDHSMDHSFGKYDDQVEEIDDLCGRILSDFKHQEQLVDRIIKVSFSG